MKKNLILFLSLVSFLFLGCSDSQKAKKLAKDYLSKNSNDGKVEIVYTDELEDYSYQDVSKQTELMHESLRQLDIARDFMTECHLALNANEAQRYRDSAQFYRDKAESLKIESDNAEVKSYHLKKMQIKARGNNVYGNKVVEDVTLFFDTNITKVSVFPKEVISN